MALTGLTLPLVLAVASALAPWRGCRILAFLLLLFVFYKVWFWWSTLTIVIDGVLYKESSSASRKRQGGGRGHVAASASVAKRSNGESKAVGNLTLPVQRSSVEKVLEESSGQVDGFQTPRDDNDPDDASPVKSSYKDACVGGIREWAPFSPSLPLGAGAGEQLPGSACASTAAASAVAAALSAGASEVEANMAAGPYWLPCDASVFLVRDIRYKQTKEKIPSDFALYDCVGVDMIRDRRRIDCVIDKLAGTKGDCPELPSSVLGAPEWNEAWGIPRVLVVSCQLPYKAGRVFGAHPEDDGGLSVNSYFVLSAQASELLAQGADSPSLRLWRRLVEEGSSTKEGISFKVIGRVEDLEKYEVPESFHRFNNKPVLLTKSSTMYCHRLPEVIEIDYDVRGWVYPARSTLANYHYRAKEAELEIGYLVEGKTDDELPEQIIGCFKLNNMDITTAQWVSIV